MKTNINIALIAIKIYGLYILYAVLASIPSTFLFLYVKDDGGFLPDMSVYFWVTLSAFIIQIIISFIFIFKTNLILKIARFPLVDSDILENKSKSLILRSAIIILGLYFLMKSLPFLIYSLLPFIPGGDSPIHSNNSFWWTKFGEKVITFIIAVILILKNKYIGHALLKIDKKSQPNVSANSDTAVAESE